MLDQVTKFVKKKMKSYLNNPNLKAEGVEIEWTVDTIIEHQKCKEDPVYFMLNYAKIINIDDGLVSFDMYDFQKDMVNVFKENRFVITRCSRQIGKSTCTVLFILWKILFNSDQSVAIAANKAATAQDILAKLKLAYEHLPKWLQQGVREWNKTSIELENNSKVKAAATGSAQLRGGSYNLIMLDEFAFVPSNVADAFFTSVLPTISSGKTGQVIIVSTPNGMNLFWKMWMDAVDKKSKFVTFEAHWYQVPWKDEEWKEQEIANLGSVEKFNQEHGCEFLGATNTLISSTVLQSLKFETPVETQREQTLKIYEHPRDDRNYLMCVDVSEGLNKDASAFSVFDVTEVPYKQVCTFRDKKISPILYPKIIAQVATKYNEAYVLVETNSIGTQVVDLLHMDEEYENIVYTTTDKTKQKISTGFGKNQKATKRGVKQSVQTKNIGCSNLKTLLEGGKLRIVDADTISELTSFIPQGRSYAAEPGCTDDMVMTSVLLGWCSTQDFIEEIADHNFREQYMEDAAVQSTMLPFSFVNGVDNVLTPEMQDSEEYIVDLKNNLLWERVEQAIMPLYHAFRRNR